MNADQQSLEGESTSGYVEQLNDIVGATSGMQAADGFSDLREFYVSEGGHTRLFYANRYGKGYVLKCLKTDFLYTPLFRQALAKEFEIGLQLEHPCICRTIGMEEVGTLGPCIVMERVDGSTLKEVIARQAVDKQMARKWVKQLANALSYMHSKQAIHRDLKPSNVMVTHNGHDVKLIDFSLADSDAFSVLKQPAGTSGYIAPEQLLPGAKADVRADIYSLGMVMKDLAQATGDKKMGRVAAHCTRRDVEARPASVGEMGALAKRDSLQFRAFVALCALLVLSAVCAAMAWHQRQVEREAASLPVPSDGNEAVDYGAWPQE